MLTSLLFTKALAPPPPPLFPPPPPPPPPPTKILTLSDPPPLPSFMSNPPQNFGELNSPLKII